MNPASTSRSGASSSIASASARSNSPRLGQVMWLTTLVVTPRSAAIARPGASGRLLTTPTTLALIEPLATASSTAVMFEPRPEIRMTMRFMFCLRPIASGDDGSGPASGTALDVADEVCSLAQRLEALARSFGPLARDDQHETDAAVEHAVHLGRGDPAGPLQPVEDRGPRPACDIDAGGEVFGKHAMGILRQPATGDVRHAFDFHLGEQRQHWFHIDAGRLEQHGAERPAAGDSARGLRQIGSALREDASYEREAVRMRAARTETDQGIALRDRPPIERPVLFHDADGEAGEVVFTGHERAWMLRCFATDERATRLLAARGDAPDDLGRNLHVEPLADVVVEEEQRLRALDQ